MDISVMSFGEALKYEPIKKTYAIRICGLRSYQKNKFRKFPLRASSLYKYIFEYIFDDFEYSPEEDDPRILFHKGIAEKIIDDFDKNSKSCESLLVHCTAGISRSPAIAITLNELFDLGHDSFELRQRFPLFNRLVYNTMMNTKKSHK